MSDTFNNWTAKARAVPIEREIERRGLKLPGTVDRCGPCPKCGGADRFSINISKQVFHCRGCDKGGDVIALVEHLDDCDFLVACALLTGEPRPKPNGKGRGAAPKRVTAATFEYTDESGATAYAIERVEYRNAAGKFVLTKDSKRKKTFSQRRPDPERPGEWLWNVDGITRLPYNMPALVEAVAAERLVYVVEGEAKVDALAELGVVATCNAGGAGKWQAEFSNCLRGASVVLVPDNDEPGFRHINDVGASLVGIAARTRVLILPGLAPKGDIKDWLAAGGTREQLDELTEQAPDWIPPTAEEADKAKADTGKAKAVADEQELIDALAQAAPLDYERRRREAAGELGIRAGALDAAVNARRAAREEEAGPPPLFGHWVVEPWPEAVDTDELILTIVKRVKRHVVLSDDEALTVALWVLFSWIHDAAAVHSPILLATSAEANSGKTQLLSLVGFLVPRALVCVEISEATLFRGIEKWLPTLLVDEADVILINNEPLRAVVNSGWTRGSCVPRCIGDDNTPHAFPTFCPKMIGLKGRKLPDTTLSRSIIIEMKRKKAGENVTHFRSIDDAGLAELRRRALRWANDNGEKLEGAEPDLPAGFDNRLGDNWSLLLAIADYAGAEWPAKARKAAASLSKVAEVASTGTRLLADIKAAFDEAGVDRISSAELVATLSANTESPWAEWKGGKPITQAQLARVLKPFGVGSEVVRLSEHSTPRGYMRSQFEDAWERYL
jgi:putative DNA primase/helicase